MSAIPDEPVKWPFGPAEVLSGDRWFSWSRIRNEREGGFICQFCQHRFKEGDSMKCTFSNFAGQRGGNPITCGDCAVLPYGDRLAVWKALGEPRTMTSVCAELGIKYVEPMRERSKP